MRAARAFLMSAALAFSAMSAQAAETDRVAPAFGNTVVSTYPDGRSQLIWLHPDGSWDGLGRKGIELAGRWAMKQGKVCLKQSRPPTLPLSYCMNLPPEPQVGVSWTSKDMAGTPIKLTVVKGMAEVRKTN
jgi:hypothetical protein